MINDIPDARPGTPGPPRGRTWHDLAYDENERAAQISAERDRLALELRAAREVISEQKAIHREYEASLKEMCGLPESASTADIATAVRNAGIVRDAEYRASDRAAAQRDRLVNGLVNLLNTYAPGRHDASTVDAVLNSTERVLADVTTSAHEADKLLADQRECARNYEKTLNDVTRVVLEMVPGQVPTDVHNMMARAKTRMDMLAKRASKRSDELETLRSLVAHLAEHFGADMDASPRQIVAHVKQAFARLYEDLEQARRSRTVADNLDLADIKVRLRELAAFLGLPHDANAERILAKARTDIYTLQDLASGWGMNILKLARLVGLENADANADANALAEQVIERLEKFGPLLDRLREAETGQFSPAAMLFDLIGLLSRKPGDDR